MEACPVEGESEFDAVRPPDRRGAGAERRARPIGARPRKQRDASAKVGLERVGAPCPPSVKVLDENRARRLSISQKPFSESRFASPQRPGRNENERMRSPIRGEFFRLVLVQRDVEATECRDVHVLERAAQPAPSLIENVVVDQIAEFDPSSAAKRRSRPASRHRDHRRDCASRRRTSAAGRARRSGRAAEASMARRTRRRLARKRDGFGSAISTKRLDEQVALMRSLLGGREGLQLRPSRQRGAPSP